VSRIKKKTPMPAEITISFGTAKGNLKDAVVRIVEGESAVPGECTLLGICQIELPRFLPKGSPVELTYSYDQNQVLEVVLDVAGRKSRVQIQRHAGLSNREIELATADLLRINIV
jgi:molecular chaperone DnaK